MSRPTRVALLVVAAAAVVWLLFTVVFPWVDRTFVTDPVVGVHDAGGEDALAAGGSLRRLRNRRPLAAGDVRA